jgi:hypothetical protein
MLVQGVLFAGVTMLFTARTCHARLAARTGLRFLLVDLPAWSRKCSVCLAIMNERWNEELLSKLDSQFELVADNTLGVISTALTSGSASTTSDLNTTLASSMNTYNASATAGQSSTLTGDDGFGGIDALGMDASTYLDAGMAGNWESFDLFRELLGVDGAQNFLDVFGRENDVGDYGQRMFLS